MKKMIYRLLAVLLTALLLSTALPFIVHASADISPTFTDEAFLMAVRANLGVAPNAPITAAQASTITHLYAQNRGISSLAGIEHLTNLLVFDISSNALTAIDFSANPSLIRVDVSGNPLSALDVRQNSNLTQLNAVSTELTTIDVTQNAKLSVLYTPGNPQLSSLDLSGNPALSELNVAYSGLTALDITQNLNLIVLIASNNQLQSLTLGNQQVLQVLDVSDNQISSLDLSGLRDLAVLTAANNQLTSLNTAQNLGIMQLIVSGNKLTGLNVANQMLLSDLRASNNQIGTLNVSGNPLLQHLEAANNRLSYLDLTQSEELVTLDISGNRMTSIDVSRNFRIFTLNVSANQLTALDITNLTRLRELDVSNNKLPSKQAITGLMESMLYSFVFDPQTPNGTDITDSFADEKLLAALRSAMGLGANSPIMLEQAALVTELVLDDWGIESLDGLAHFTNLDSLSLVDNSLAQLDMSMLPQLKELDVTSNQLTALDITGNPALERLWAADNYLEQLDLRKNPVLHTLDVAGNLLPTLWLAENTALQSLNASRNLLQNLDLTSNASLRSLDVRYNFMENENALLKAASAYFSTYRFYPQNALDMDVTEYFLDPAFLAAIRTALGKQADEPISASELRAITALDISGQSIENLAGLGFLTNLERLNASDNRITGIDISNNIKLQYLDIRMNWMESAAAVNGLRESITTEYYFAPQKLSGTNITTLFPDENFLAALRDAMGKGSQDPIGSIDAATTETLDLSNKGIVDTTGLEYFTGLKSLNLAGNPLQSLGLSHNTALMHLDVSGACLEALNLTANVALEQVDVSGNHLTALNLLASRNLKALNAAQNFLESQAVIRLPNPAPQTVQFNPQNNRTRLPATCTEAAVSNWVCGNNSAHTVTATQSGPLGHSWNSVVTRPTFTQPGYTTHTCSRANCGESYTSDPQPVVKLEYPATLSLQYNQATSVFADIDRRAPDLTWRSSNTKALKIDDNGIISYPRVGRGTTTVTATDKNGVERVRINVTVKIVWWQWLIIIFLFGWIWY